MKSPASRSFLILLCGLAVAGGAHADARDDLMSAFKKAFDGRGYRAETTVEVKGKPYVTRMDVQWPDRFHMKTPDTEMIILPGATWMNAGGQWMNMPMDMSKMIQGYSKKAMDESMATVQQVEVIGHETVDGCDSTVYRYETHGKFMGVDNNGKAEVAICDETQSPVRTVAFDRKGARTATVHYDFSVEVDIRAPR